MLESKRYSFVLNRIKKSISSVFSTVVLKILYKSYYYSGISFIVSKACPETIKGEQPTIVIWLFSIYVAFFGLATQYYEGQLDRYENKLNILTAQLGTKAINQTFPALIALQKYKLPPEPSFGNPIQTFNTFFSSPLPISDSQFHKEKVIEIADIIYRFNDIFGCPESSFSMRSSEAECMPVNLSDGIFIGGKFNGAYLQNTKLSGANLSFATLYNTNLNRANLQNANLKNAKFYQADLRFSELQNANLENAKMHKVRLDGATLQGTNLKNVSGLDCEILMLANNWKNAYRDENLACGEQIPKVDL